MLTKDRTTERLPLGTRMLRAAGIAFIIYLLLVVLAVAYEKTTEEDIPVQQCPAPCMTDETRL